MLCVKCSLLETVMVVQSDSCREEGPVVTLHMKQPVDKGVS